MLYCAWKDQFSCTICPLQVSKKFPPEKTRKNLHSDEKPLPERDPALAIQRQPTTRHNTVDMKVIYQGL
jgi:hypothetical protein